jgi:alkylated DNA nucleotide flippase Atl1
MESSLKQDLISLINELPEGQVVAYGTLAQILNMRHGYHTSWRIVGRILTSMPQHEWNTCPRWRVVNKEGIVSSLKLGHKGLVQVQLLQKEDIEVREGRVNMRVYGWKGE